MEEYIDYYDSTNIFDKYFEYVSEDFYDIFTPPPIPPPEINEMNILLIIYLCINIINKQNENRLKQLRFKCKKKQRR